MDFGATRRESGRNSWLEPPRRQPYADYTAVSVAVLSDEASGRKDTLLRNGSLWPGARKPWLRSIDAGPYHRGHRGTQGKPTALCWISSVDLFCVPRALCGKALCFLGDAAR